MQMSFALENLDLINEALNASAIVAITDSYGKIKFANETFCKLSGYSQKELIGQNHRILKSDYHPPEFYRDLWRTIASGRMWEGEICNRNKSGRLYWVKTYIFPFTDPATKEKEFVSIRWEMTEEKEKETNMKSLMDAAMDGLLIYDRFGRVIWENSKAPGILSQKSLKGLTVARIFGTHYRVYFLGTQELVVGEPGSRVFEVSTEPFQWEGQIAYLVNFRDITEKVRIQSQMIQQDRLASLGLIAAGLVHEVKTPMGVIRGRTELIEMNLDNPVKVYENIKIIQNQMDRMSDLLQELLELGKPAPGVKPHLIFPENVLSKVLSFLDHEMSLRNIEFKKSISNPLQVLGEDKFLFQIFLNLLLNAIHSFADLPQDHDRQIEVYDRMEDGRYQIVIKDNGCGISEEAKEHIFVPLFTTKKTEGTGLGLIVSRKMIRGWGGDLVLESKEAVGTEAILSFSQAEALSPQIAQ
ncbi:MAG TPA: hypothetical protein DCL41_02905 [Bdellovibrionales bacterium]|nr:hypothetical protein [Bdellovibrionales bacterium]